MKFFALILIGILSYISSIKIKSKIKKSNNNQNYRVNAPYTDRDGNGIAPSVSAHSATEYVIPKNNESYNTYNRLNREQINNAIEIAKSQSDHPLQVSSVI